MSHTPTPWFVEDSYSVFGSDGNPVAECDNLLRSIYDDEDKAAFIIKAVNAYDELVSALSNLANEMRFMLERNPSKDGGLYRQRLNEAEAALTKTGAL